MKKNKFIHAFFMFSLIACLATSCKSDGGGGSANGSGGGNNSIDNSTDPTVGTGSFSIGLSWSPPATRVNGDKLYAYEIGGYEVLYRKVGEEAWKSITIHDQEKNLLDNYTIQGVSSGRYEVKMATFDIDGLYSQYSDPAFVDKF